MSFLRIVARRRGLDTGGKPSTWFPPGRLVEQSNPQTAKGTNNIQQTEARRLTQAETKRTTSNETTKTKEHKQNRTNKTAERHRDETTQSKP